MTSHTSRFAEPLEPRTFLANLLPDLVTIADPFRQVMHDWRYGASRVRRQYIWQYIICT